MTQFEPTDWPRRLAERTAEHKAKKAAKRAERLEFQTQRAYGLEARHAKKLRGGRGTQRGRGAPETVAPQTNPGDDMPYPPPCCASAPDQLCEQHRQAHRVMRFQGPRKRSAGGGSRVVGDPGTAKTARDTEENR